MGDSKGFKSPKTKGAKTVQLLVATSVGITDLPKRTAAEPLVVRKMAIKRIQKLDTSAQDMYADLK